MAKSLIINEYNDNYSNIFSEFSLDLSFVKGMKFKFKVKEGTNAVSSSVVSLAKLKESERLRQYLEGDNEYLLKYVNPIYFINTIHYADWIKLQKGEKAERKKHSALYQLITKTSWRGWEALSAFPSVPLNRPVRALFLSNNFAFSCMEPFILYRRSNAKKYHKDHYVYYDFQRYLSGGITHNEQEIIAKVQEIYGVEYVNVEKDICQPDFMIGDKYDFIALEIAYLNFDKMASVEEHLADETKNFMYSFITIKFIINNLKEGGSLHMNNRELHTKFTAQILFLLASCFENSYLVKLSSTSSNTNWKRFIGIGFRTPGEAFLKDLDKVHRKLNALHTKCICKTDLLPNVKFVNSIIDVPAEFYNKIKLMNNIIYNNIILSYQNYISLRNKLESMNEANGKLYIEDLEEYIRYNSAEWFKKFGIPVSFKYSRQNMRSSILQDMYSFILPISFEYKWHQTEIEEGSEVEPYEELERIYSEYLIYQTAIDGLEQEKWEKIKFQTNLLVGLKKSLAKFTGSFTPSQAFLKFYEILSTFRLLPSRGPIKTLHICEAPGNFILSTEHYVKATLGEDVDWYAQSLNPDHPDNIKKFGEGIFGDSYGLFASNPDRWIWGADGTGDITNPDNITSYHELAEGSCLISSDCGLAKETSEFAFIEEKMLLTNLAQILFIMSNLPHKGSYVFKAYLPFKLPFNVSLIYLLYMSTARLHIFKPSLNPGSTEVYVVGKGYRGISPDIIARLMDILRSGKVEEYQELVRVPPEFLHQHEKMVETLLTNNKMYIMKKMYFYENPDMLDSSGINLGRERAKAERDWIRRYNFGKV